MSEVPEKISLLILDFQESPSLFVTYNNKYMAELPFFQSFEWDFLVIDTPKGEDLIFSFEFVNNFNPYINWRQGLRTFNSDQRDYHNPSPSFSNDFTSSNKCAAPVGHSRTPSVPTSVHIPSPNCPKSLLLSRDEVVKEKKDFGEDNFISLLHLFHGNRYLPILSWNDSLKNLWDQEQKPEEIETIMKVVPSA
ncbi:hypothetical protein O181_024949 [Austropuccinia psidii MF-1]|uniref:Uncharacterized protein n=1 Tax=Austropuccinia psidii MF-1 TaxID=1389203 RepID=A0A9Q3CH47_9BASI|nr:hypothetical protein [Austropuccinia psidii MF-1]